MNRKLCALALSALPLLAQASPGLFGPGPFRPDVPRPTLGARYTRQGEILAYLQALAAAAPDRVRLSIPNRTEEGHPQPLLILTSPGNLTRLEALKAAGAKLADPRTCTPEEAAILLRSQPAFIWLGYSVHGFEAGGAEAALAVAYRFAAGTDPKTLEQLDRVVLVMDVTQNPDGRERHLQAVAEATQGTNPPDPQDAQNAPPWPGGRFNHRLFDLNRDWAFQTQGESRAKAALFREWNPQVAVDHHEMSPENDPFFPPNMEPANPLLPAPFAGPWQERIGKAIAARLDAAGRAYFTREIYDLFAPIYGDSWASLQGIAGLTFEGPNPGGLAVRRLDGELLTLETRIAGHVAASLSAVEVASEQRAQLLEDYIRVRRERVARASQAGAFVFGGPSDPGKARSLAELLERNGIEVGRTAQDLPAKAMEAIGPGRLPDAFPAGSYLVALDQPRGALAQVLLTREVPVGNRPSFDITAWSLPILRGVTAAFCPLVPKAAPRDPAPAASWAIPSSNWGYVLPWREGQEKVLATLLKEGFRARSLPGAATLGIEKVPAGSLVFQAAGTDAGRLHARLSELSATYRTPVLAVAGARTEAGPDLGSSKALRLRIPRIALLMDAPAQPTSAGEMIHTLREIGLPFTQLRASRFANAALRYSHLLIPDDGAGGKRWQKSLGEAGFLRLKNFLQEGGVVVASRGGAAAMVRGGVSDAATLHYLAKAEEEAWQKEKDPKREKPKADPVDSFEPWGQREERSLKEQIPGSLVKVRLDLSHPLAYGMGAEEWAVLNLSDPILEPGPGAEAPVFHPKEPLRVAGLLPSSLEAKLQQSAWVLREKKGRGALILFAGNPLFRGAAAFAARSFTNALFFGGYAPPDEDD